MKKISALVFMVLLLSAGFAQEAAESSSLEDELFGSDSDTEMLVTPEQANAESQKKGISLTGDLNTASLSLESNKLRIGGSLNAELGLKYVWTDP